MTEEFPNLSKLSTGVTVDRIYLLYLHEEVLRPPQAKQAWAIKTPTLEIPWPEGTTFSEALRAWKAAS